MGGPIVMFIYYISTGLFLRSIMPSFAKLCSEQQLLENQFRFGHSRLIHHSEEISFYSAHDREKQIISTLFSNVFAKSISIFRLQAFVNGSFSFLDSSLSSFLPPSISLSFPSLSSCLPFPVSSSLPLLSLLLLLTSPSPCD